MRSDDDLTDAQRRAIVQASDWELYQSIEKAIGADSTAFTFADAIGGVGDWFERNALVPATAILESAEAEIYRLVCVEWGACAKLPSLSEGFELATQIADVLLTFVGGIPGIIFKRAVAFAIASLLAHRGIGTFCACPGQ